MKKFKIQTRYSMHLADMTTPVNIYLKLRDKYPNSILLESADSHAAENSYSFICCKPISTFTLNGTKVSISWPDNSREEYTLEKGSLVKFLEDYSKAFEASTAQEENRFLANGLFGYTAFDCIPNFESIAFDPSKVEAERKVPEAVYSMYRFIIAINHFKDEMYIIDNRWSEEKEDASESIETIEYLIKNRDYATYRFKIEGDETSNFENTEFINHVNEAKKHIMRGDVFQLVLSRRFSREFSGDEFNVYRALRSINPSPYLFYFDYGSYKIMGSSPEAQLEVNNETAYIHPIAGTFRRTGNEAEDQKLAQQLTEDPKENAEHVMLVDLARNDLSRNCSEVSVEKYREVHYYSHVIHLVSKVSGKMKQGISAWQLLADTFPAGTLSGAPKFRAMEIIDKLEKGNRGVYGGCIGYVGLNGTFNHAIMIRSFLSRNNKLYYQAGAGIVASSDPQMELQEVNNKLGALKMAIERAATIQ